MRMKRLRARFCMWAMRWLRATEHTSRSPRARNRCDEGRFCCDSDLSEAATGCTTRWGNGSNVGKNKLTYSNCLKKWVPLSSSKVTLHLDTKKSGNFTKRLVWKFLINSFWYWHAGCDFQDFARGSDVDSQLCVYVKGERVVDLWGSHGPHRDANYGPDSLQNIFSSGKSVASVCMARLVDKGLLDYNEKVSKYWPGM